MPRGTRKQRSVSNSVLIWAVLRTGWGTGCKVGMSQAERRWLWAQAPGPGRGNELQHGILAVVGAKVGGFPGEGSCQSPQAHKKLPPLIIKLGQNRPGPWPMTGKMERGRLWPSAGHHSAPSQGPCMPLLPSEAQSRCLPARMVLCTLSTPGERHVAVQTHSHPSAFLG